MVKFLWIPAVVFALDQYTKFQAVKYLLHQHTIEVLPFLNFTLVYNTGATFGFLSSASGWQNLLFVIVGIIVSLFILVMVKRLGANDVQVIVALMLILGGAAGNILDRLHLGYVVDFIDVYYRSWHWWTFNIADSAITIGAILLFLDAMGWGFRKRHN